MSSEATARIEPAVDPYIILVAVAPDETARAALVAGARLARGQGNVEFHVLRVVGSDNLAQLDDALAGAPQSLGARVNEVLQELESPPERVIVHTAGGVPGPHIIQCAADVEADVVVVGCNPRSGFKRFLVGSTADDVVHGAHCPVMVAIPKDHTDEVKTPSIVPTCPDCLAARELSSGATQWCARHGEEHEIMRHTYSMRP